MIIMNARSTLYASILYPLSLICHYVKLHVGGWSVGEGARRVNWCASTILGNFLLSLFLRVWVY